MEKLQNDTLQKFLDKFIRSNHSKIYHHLLLKKIQHSFTIKTAKRK